MRLQLDERAVTFRRVTPEEVVEVTGLHFAMKTELFRPFPIPLTWRLASF